MVPRPSSLRVGSRTVDLERGVITGPSYTAQLTSIELKLLRYLSARGGQVATREELYHEVWGYKPGVQSRALDATVRRLRSKLEPTPRAPRHVLTEHGSGYRLVVDRHDVLELLNVSRAVPPTQPAEIDAMLVSLEERLEGDDPQTCVAEGVQLMRILRRYGRREQALSLCDRLVATEISPRERIWVRAETLGLHRGTRFEAEAEQLWTEALASGDAALQSRVALLSARGDVRQARLRRAVRLADGAGAAFLLMQARGQLATTLQASHPNEAHSLYLEALRSAQLLDDGWEEAVIGANYARFLQERGAMEEAVRWLERALVEFEAWDDRTNMVMTHLNLGVFGAQRLRLEDARRHFRQGQQMAEAMNADHLRVICRLNALACADTLADQPVEELETLLKLCRQLAYQPEEALTLTLISQARQARGQLALARAPMEQAVSVAETLDDGFRAEIHGYLALLLLAFGEPDGAPRLRASIEALLEHADYQAPLARFLLRWVELPEAANTPQLTERLVQLADELPAPVGSAWEALRHHRTGWSEKAP